MDVTKACVYVTEHRVEPALWLRAAHRDHATVVLRIPLPEPTHLLAGSAVLDPVEIELHPAGHVRGVVLDADGSPRPHARVAILGWHGDEIQPDPIDVTWADEKGAFALSSARSGRHLVAATWAEYDLARGVDAIARRAPACEFVDVVVGEVVSDLTLRLRRGYEIRGRVLQDGQARAGVSLSWSLTLESTRFHLYRAGSLFERDERYIFTDGQVHAAAGEFRTDDEGAFVIPGLSALACRLRVEHLPARFFMRRRSRLTP